MPTVFLCSPFHLFLLSPSLDPTPPPFLSSSLRFPTSYFLHHSFCLLFLFHSYFLFLLRIIPFSPPYFLFPFCISFFPSVFPFSHPPCLLPSSFPPPPLLLLFSLIFLFFFTFLFSHCTFLSIGDGKTHYIQQQLSNSSASLTVAVNEAFTPLNTISKLRSLPFNREECAIFFNFTMLPPGVREGRKEGKVDRSL